MRTEVTVPKSFRPALIKRAKQQMPVNKYGEARYPDGSGCSKSVWRVELDGRSYALKRSRWNDINHLSEVALQIGHNKVRKHLAKNHAWAFDDGWFYTLQDWCETLYSLNSLGYDEQYSRAVSESDHLFASRGVYDVVFDSHSGNIATDRQGRYVIIDAGCNVVQHVGGYPTPDRSVSWSRRFKLRMDR